MTKPELTKALEMAKNIDVGNGSISMFDGFNLPHFPKTCVSLQNLAALIRCQCRNLDNSINENNLNEIWQARKKIIVV
ncbi:MAG: hypothetical protein AABY22_02605 [Nanoarchaeota archaeon]